MAWPTALTDLRSLLSDGPTDRPTWQKQVIGIINGTNKVFKTFENRRVTDFKTIKGVWKDGVLLELADVASDDPISGQFELVAAPADGSRLSASYYFQWFSDSELTTFLISAADWVGIAGQYLNMDPGLVPAAKQYAAAEAYQKMGMRWQEARSDNYRLEDSLDPNKTAVGNPYFPLARESRKQADQLRKDFYGRNGQNNAPLFSFVAGRKT